MRVITRVEKGLEVQERLGALPGRLRRRLTRRITELTKELQAEVIAAAPMRTGRLRSEIKARVFSDRKHVGGYVSVYAPGVKGEYVKAGALEYGRHAYPGTRRLIHGKNRRAKARLSKGNRINAFRYLRGPLSRMHDEALAAISEAVTEATAESNVT